MDVEPSRDGPIQIWNVRVDARVKLPSLLGTAGRGTMCENVSGPSKS